MTKLSVVEHRNRNNPSEVVRVDIEGGHSIVVEYLGSRKCTVIDLLYPNGVRLRVESIYDD